MSESKHYKGLEKALKAIVDKASQNKGKQDDWKKMYGRLRFD